MEKFNTTYPKEEKMRTVFLISLFILISTENHSKMEAHGRYISSNDGNLQQFSRRPLRSRRPIRGTRTEPTQMSKIQACKKAVGSRNKGVPFSECLDTDNSVEKILVCGKAAQYTVSINARGYSVAAFRSCIKSGASAKQARSCGEISNYTYAINAKKFTEEGFKACINSHLKLEIIEECGDAAQFSRYFSLDVLLACLQ